jgi:hypothetical protein
VAEQSRVLELPPGDDARKRVALYKIVLQALQVGAALSGSLLMRTAMRHCDGG